MPNFLIIGAQKSGTTSVYHYLSQHPDIFMSPVKEPRFFALGGEIPDFQGPGDERVNSNSIADIERYQTLFAGSSNENAVGEASNIYLYNPRAPGHIREHVPDARLIAFLRQPVDRAFSAFMHLRRDGREPESSFEAALREEAFRIRKNWEPLWHYVAVGRYSDQLDRYFRLFDRDQLRIYLYDELHEKPLDIIRDIFAFLEVDKSFVPDLSLRHNVSGRPLSRKLDNIIAQPNILKDLVKPVIPSKFRIWLRESIRTRLLLNSKIRRSVFTDLMEIFREDILKVQDLIQKDLLHWLS